MPAKHSTRTLGTARLIFSAGAAVLVMLVVWVAVRAVGPAEASRQPTVVLPSMPQVQITPAAVPSASPSLSPSAVVVTSASPTTTSRSPIPEKTSKSPSPTPTRARVTTTAPAPPPPSPPPAAVLAAAVSVGASWEQGYVAGVRVENTGKKSANWTVTVTHGNLADLRLVGTWGARGTQQGDRVVFTGGPLAAGATVNFGYQTSKTGRGNARPSGCTVVGGTCGVR